MLDTNSDTLLRINFNVTMLDLQCDYAAVDGGRARTNSMNVTKNVEKWQLDEHGKRMIFQGRNREQKAISTRSTTPRPSRSTMANGIHAVPLTEGGFLTNTSRATLYAFINFYAPWCIWCQRPSLRTVVFSREAMRAARRCQRLEPTWEAMAEDFEVDVAKVDCVANRNLCGAQRIQAFPTLRFFKDGKQYGLDYRQDRTVQALTAFLKQKVELEKTMEDWCRLSVAK